MKVLIPQDVNQEGKDYLIERGYEVVVGSGWDPETIKREVADADALLCRTAQYPADVIAAGKKLKVMARYGVGTDNIDVKAAEAQGVYVTIAKNCNVDSVAEQTIALMLACAKHIPLLNNATRAGEFAQRNKIPTKELKGKVIGIIGMGAIGMAVARKAHFGFGMDVVGYDVFADKMDLPDFVESLKSVEDVLKKSDVVSLHVPATKETANMINKESIALMKDGAILINCARGGVVNEDDLYDALVSGKLFSAGMDVFQVEPPQPDNKLFTLDKFIASPHNAGLTKEAGVAMALSAAKAIDDVLSGRKPQYPINNPVGKATA